MFYRLESECCEVSGVDVIDLDAIFRCKLIIVTANASNIVWVDNGFILDAEEGH